MEDKNVHSKIIKQVCKEILIPLGVFQKGTSRVYLDDNDYFFTVIEFQPSCWSRGTYLNIGLIFLWKYNPDLLPLDFPREIGGRYSEFVQYENEIQFRNEVIKLVNIAKEEILFYRKLRDVKFAKEWMIEYVKHWDRNYYRYGLPIANICILNDEKELAEFYYKNYFRERNKEMQMNDKELNKEYIVSNIKSTRKIWHSEKSMRKMPTSVLYDS